MNIMPLPFSLVCDLLEHSHRLCLARKSNKSAVESWFERNRTRIEAHDTNLPALLSTLLPEKRSDRVYFIQAPTLEKIIGRGLSLGTSRKLELARHREPGSGVDLAECVECILSVTPTHVLPGNTVTVEEIDELLHGLASRIKWSSPSVRAPQTPLTQRNRGDLERVYTRLTVLEAKWLTRLVLKSYAPLVFDENLIFRLCDPMLPSVLKIRGDFTSAVHAVQSYRTRLLPNTGGRDASRRQFLAKVKPEVGVKVGRQHWVQARSIKHCLDQGKGRMSVENKIDGEYCQIHIDLSKGANCVQIFSKSGKDSTEDREGLHDIIKDSLKIGQTSCCFSKACIIEGELVVYSDLTGQVLPFHKIRNHVTRRGRFLNTDQDSLPKDGEHLMIVYYDILLLDDESMLGVRHSERFKVLESLIERRKGWSELVQREIIDFGHNLAASNLRKVFAQIIVNKREGLVLKPDEPYFDFTRPGQPWSGRCIKMKKEYIGNFGDVGDFAAVGAGYDPIKAKQYRISNLRWTHFYIGCLENRDEVKRWSAKPEFTVVSTVEINESMLKSVVHFGNPVPVSRQNNNAIKLNIAPGTELNPRMSIVFTNPLVFDLRCFSFEKGGTTGFWSLRFPVVSKVHFDRDFTDTISFAQLQDMAKEATNTAEPPDSQENLHWIARLEGADPRGIAVDTVSQQTATTMPTPSPSRSTQTMSQTYPTSPLAARKSMRPQANIPSPRQIADLSMPASQPLVTPPTSSPPTEISPRKRLHNRGAKRGSPSPQKQAESQKKRKSAGQSQASRSTPQRPNASQTRKPLAEINANSSQQSLTSFPPSSQPFTNAREEAYKEVIDLTSSPESSFLPITTTMKPTAEEGGCSQDSDFIFVFPPDDDESQSHDQTRSPNTSQGQASDETTVERSQMEKSLKDDQGSAHRSGCAYLRGQCSLAKRTVLLAPQLQAPLPEIAELLDSHGISNSLTDVKGWMKDLHRGFDSNAILLVDQINNPEQTADFLKELQELRNALSSARQDEVVEIYDWRLLEHLTRFEDPNIIVKYYDGFKTPWRRWYCGLV